MGEQQGREETAVMLAARRCSVKSPLWSYLEGISNYWTKSPRRHPQPPNKVNSKDPGHRLTLSVVSAHFARSCLKFGRTRNLKFSALSFVHKHNTACAFSWYIQQHPISLMKDVIYHVTIFARTRVKIRKYNCNC